MLTKGIGFEAKDVTEDGVIEGYGSVFGGAQNVDAALRAVKGGGGHGRVT